MKRIFLVAAILIMVFSITNCSLFRQNDAPKAQSDNVLAKDDFYRLMFYNVENLFDTIDDPLKKDEDFTPEGSYRWDGAKYQQKLDNIARVTMALGNGKMPDIIGFCEVENRKVLEDLNELSGFKSFDYRVIHQESLDERGIDVAIFYRSGMVTPIAYRSIRVEFEEPDTRPTRDILYFEALLSSNDTLHFFVNHWPSRYGGAEKTIPYRKAAAKAARSVVDSILSVNPAAHIVLTGDFNDDPDDESLAAVLEAKTPGTEARLINFTYPYKTGDQRGTLKYRGNWNYFDQFIVSDSMIDGEGLQTSPSDYHIYYGEPGFEFLLEVDDRFQGMQPNRTYWGRTFHGGFSDHLPVYLDIYPAGKPQ